MWSYDVLKQPRSGLIHTIVLWLRTTSKLYNTAPLEATGTLMYLLKPLILFGDYLVPCSIELFSPRSSLIKVLNAMPTQGLSYMFMDTVKKSTKIQ